MKFNKFLFTIISSIMLMQNLTAMYRLTPKPGQTFANPFSNQKSEELKIVAPEATLNPKVLEQTITKFKAAQQPTQQTTTYTPKMNLHPSLKAPFEKAPINKQNFGTEEKMPQPEPKMENGRTEDPAKEQSKRNFWDSAYKKMKFGTGAAGLTTTAGSLGYGYLQQEQAAQAQEEAQQNYEELKKDIVSLEKIIKTFNSDQSTWTDYHQSIFNRYLTLYNYLSEKLSSEELIAEYVYLKNQLIAIEDLNFLSSWTELLSSGKNWTESNEAYKKRKKSDAEEYQKEFIAHEIIKQKHIAEIANVAKNSDRQLRIKVRQLKPKVILEQPKIKHLHSFKPEQKAQAPQAVLSIPLPELSEAIRANLNEGNF